MDEQSNVAAGGRPKFLSSTTGIIGGLTALVVAVGGLATATKDLWRSEPKAQASAPAETGTDETTAVPQDETASTEEGAPTSYTVEGGGGGEIAEIEGKWVWTTANDTRYEYEEESNDGTTIVAVLRQGPEEADAYLRWPLGGGTALQSFDEKESWGQPVKFTAK